MSRALVLTRSMSARVLLVVSMCRSAMMKNASYSCCSRIRFSTLPTKWPRCSLPVGRSPVSIRLRRPATSRMASDGADAVTGVVISVLLVVLRPSAGQCTAYTKAARRGRLWCGRAGFRPGQGSHQLARDAHPGVTVEPVVVMNRSLSGRNLTRPPP
jgi:hypothetical protein